MARSRFGHIQRLGEGRYRVFWRDNGARKSHVVHGTLDDAEVYLARMRIEDREASTTWREFWIARVEPSLDGLAVKTVDEYRRLWKRELEPRIGGEAVSAMDWSRANDVLTDIGSPSVQRHAGALLKKMCNMAIRDRAHLLQYNPVDRAIEYAPHRRRRKVLVESLDVGRYVDAFMQTKYAPVLLAELGSGLRVEEACALTWDDVSEVEYKGGVYAAFDVSKALVTTAGGLLLKDTKNEPSARTAVCGEPFASLVLGLRPDENAPLVPSGRLYQRSNPAWWYTSPATIAHNWKTWCERHGIPYVAPRDMRSSYATLMGEAMAPDSVVSGNMGHSDGTTKGRNYQAVTIAAKCRAAGILAGYLADL